MISGKKMHTSEGLARMAFIGLCIVAVVWTGLEWNCMSLYATAVMDELNITRTVFMFALTIDAGVSAVVNLFLFGRLERRFGMRKLILIGGFLDTLSFLLWAISPNVVVFYLASFVYGAGASITGYTCITAAVNCWYKMHMGRVVGVVNTCGSVSGIAFSLVVAAVIAFVGWRASFLISLVLSIMSYAAVFFLYKGDPEDLGVEPMYAEEAMAFEAALQAERAKAQEAETAQGFQSISGSSDRENLGNLSSKGASSLVNSAECVNAGACDDALESTARVSKANYVQSAGKSSSNTEPRNHGFAIAKPDDSPAEGTDDFAMESIGDLGAEDANDSLADTLSAIANSGDSPAEGTSDFAVESIGDSPTKDTDDSSADVLLAVEDFSAQGLSYAKTAKHPRYVAMAGAYLLMGIMTYAVMASLALFAHDLGFDSMQGVAVSVSLASSAVMMSPLGAICDRFGSKWGLGLCGALILAACLLLRVHSLPLAGLLVAAACSGAAYNCCIVPIGVSVKEAFGERDFSRKLGLPAGCSIVGISLAPVVINFFYELFGNYDLVLLLFGALAICTALVFQWATRRSY